MKSGFFVLAGMVLSLLAPQVSLAESQATCADASYVGVLAVMNQASDAKAEKMDLSKMMADSDACRELLKTVQTEALKAKSSGELTPLLKEQFSEIEAIDATISKDQMVNALIEPNLEK
jgi:hypothetical protein